MSILVKAAKIGIITASLGLSALVGCAKKETVKTTPAPAADPKPTDGTAAGGPTGPAVAATPEPANGPTPAPAPPKRKK